MQEETTFEVIRNGRVAGPFTIIQLKEMNLSGSDFVKPAGYQDFKEVRELKRLSDVLGIAYEWTQPQYFATMDMRVLGAAVDYLIVTLVFAMVVLLWILATGAGQPAMIRLLLFGIIAVPAGKFLLNVFSESSKRQASPGKRAVGIKVCSLQGKPIGWGRSIVRNLAKIVGIATLGIGFFSGFFDKRQQCLHDKIAGTLVIRDRLI